MTGRRALVVAGALAAALSGCTAAAPPGPALPAAVPAPAASGPAAGTADVVARLASSVVTVRTGQGAGSGVVYRPDVVLAIGSPLGFEGTVTSGIVSGLDRQIPGSAAQSRALVDLIQVDAAISPGNSGGALLDAQGRVVGINEAYIPPAAGAVSTGFAIPAATAVDIAEQLLADGTAVHPYLGVRLGPLTPQLRTALGVAAERGALVSGVEPGGPAAVAGVAAGDVVVELDGREVAAVEDVLGALRDTEPGRATEISVGGERLDLPLTIGSEPTP